MKNNYLKNFLKVIYWPILFTIGHFLILFAIELVYICFDDIKNFSNFLNNHSYIVAILNIIILLPIFKKQYKKYQINYKQNIKDIHKIIILGIVLSLIINIILLVFKPLENLSTEISIFLILNTCIVGPILEEYVFRGIVFNKLLEFNNKKESILITTTIFALIHGNILNIIYAFIMGLIMNIIYIKYKNIKMPIIYHITINITATVILPIICKPFI